MSPKYNVLYVDDEPLHLEITKRYLEKKGEFSVECVLSGDEAISLITHRHYDVIVSDYQMPVMDGITLLKKVRETDRTMPFILLTGKGKEEVVIDAINSGADFYLKKGLEVGSQYDELSHKIRAVGERRNADKVLKESDEKYRAIIDDSNMGLFQIKPDGHILNANHAFARMFGYFSAEELLLANLNIERQLYADPEDWRKLIRILADNGKIENYETLFIRKDGKHFWASITSRVFMDSQGHAIYYEGTIIDITERKQVLEQLLLKNIIFESSITADSITDNQGIITSVNPAFLRIWGYRTKEEAIGKPISSFLVNENDAAQVLKILDSTGRWEGEFVAKKSDGGTFIALGTATIIRNEKGDKIGFLSTCLDITENKRVEKELKRKNQELMASYEQLAASEGILKNQFIELADREQIIRFNERRLLMAQHIGRTGCWEYNPSTGTVWSSAEGFRILGFPEIAGEISIEKIESCIQVQERERVHQALVDLLTEEKEYNLEYGINPADGSDEKIIHSIARLEKEDIRNQVRVIGVIQDITERKLAEKALCVSEEKFRAIFNSTFQYIGLLKPDGTVIEVNMPALDLAGIKLDDVINKPFWDAPWWRHSPEEQEALRKGITRAANGEFVRFEATPRGVNNSTHYIDFSIKPVFDSDGNVVLLIPEGRDISERKKAENALIRVNRKLNVLNDITRKDLISQIFILRSYLELALQPGSDPDATIRILHKMGDIIKLINNITEFTRDYQNLGESPPIWQNVNLTFLYGISHITLGNIRQKIDLENLEIFADPLLEKAFQGLFENTLAHGGQVSTIRISYMEIPDGIVIIYEDNGSGIPHGRKDEIFLRCKGVNNSGRGLFYIREILSITGITIRETGEPGRGVRFEMTVPAESYRFVSVTGELLHPGQEHT